MGTGSGIPLGDRASPSLLVLMGSHPIFFDLGPGTLRQLSKVGITHPRIGQIFISHLHPDHTADLIHFLFATRHPPILENREPFSITGPLGFREFLKKLLLLHFYPETLTANIARECRKTYSGELILGRDLMHISL